MILTMHGNHKILTYKLFGKHNYNSEAHVRYDKEIPDEYTLNGATVCLYNELD